MLNDSVHYHPTKQEEAMQLKKDRMEDLKLPDINTSRASDHGKSIGVSTLDKRENTQEETKTQVNKTASGSIGNHGGTIGQLQEDYTDEEKAKI